jgi:GNAT superfamily N-acetyltransferase
MNSESAQRDAPAESSPASSALMIESACPADVADIVAMIRELAEYEKLSHLCVSTEADLARALFGSPARAEVIIGQANDQPACFALFFHNFSTFLGRPGLYLEDLFVRPAHRRKGYGRAMLAHLASLAEQRGCGRFEWSVLDWNESAIRFYESLGATVLPDWRITRVTGDALRRLAAHAPQRAAR